MKTSTSTSAHSESCASRKGKGHLMAQAQLITRATHGDSLADILERVLNTGLVIAGDIRIKLCDVELLSIQLRLLICSVDKARELGISWWWQTAAQSAPAFGDRRGYQMDPANAEAYRYLGLALYADGHYDAALHAFDEALAREPANSLANADVYFDMGIAHRDQGDPRRAAIAYRHA